MQVEDNANAFYIIWKYFGLKYTLNAEVRSQVRSSMTFHGTFSLFYPSTLFMAIHEPEVSLCIFAIPLL